SKTIEEKHVLEAMKSTGSVSLKSTLKTLSKDEKTLLRSITEFKGNNLVAGDLYRCFKRKTSSSYASFDRTLNKLEFLRIIDTRFTGKGVKGNSRIVILRFDPKEIGKCMKTI
ncbi:MAG: AAA family ATPase, partial [Methanobacterium paludis]|nr:AAA family ATPase [Methanobacterium paludis]